MDKFTEYSKFTEYRTKRLSPGEIAEQIGKNEVDLAKTIQVMLEHQGRLIDVINYLQSRIDQQGKQIKELSERLDKLERTTPN